MRLSTCVLTVVILTIWLFLDSTMNDLINRADTLSFTVGWLGLFWSTVGATTGVWWLWYREYLHLKLKRRLPRK